MSSHRTPALIHATELAERLKTPMAIVVVDCRHDLAQPHWGERAYQQAHIPGAAFAHLDRDLSGAVTPSSGRHPLPDRARFASFLGGLGIGPDTLVVGYDQDKTNCAARLWWLLRWMGHEPVAALDGGFAAWQAADLPVTTVAPSRPPVTFVIRQPLVEYITSAALQDALASNTVALFDARTADRFAGQNETFDPVPGHIPGARNLPFTSNMDATGRFLPAATLTQRWQGLLEGRPPVEVVNSCGSGVTACVNLLAMDVAGLHGARLYAGSWSEWIRDPARPVTTGAG